MSNPIDTPALGLTSGILWGLGVVFLEVAATFDYGERWRILLGDIYPGYEPGDLVWGAIVGFLDAFTAGIVFGWLYNRLAD